MTQSEIIQLEKIRESLKKENPNSETLLLIDQMIFLSGLEACLRIIPKNLPSEWKQGEFEYAKGIAKIIIKRVWPLVEKLPKKSKPSKSFSRLDNLIFLNALETCICLLPQSLPADWEAGNFREAKMLANRIIEKLGPFLNEGKDGLYIPVAENQATGKTLRHFDAVLSTNV